MAIDIFKTRVMLPALEQAYKPKLFLRDTFFKRETRSNSKYVDIDVMKGKRRLAPFVSPLIEGKVVSRIGFTTHSFEPPYIKQKKITNAGSFLDRPIGIDIYSANDGPQQRAQKELMKDLLELNEMIDRREEWMAAQLLATGKVDCIGEGISVTVDFSMPASHTPTLTGNAVWTDETNANPLKDLRDWKRLLAKDSGIVPDVVIFGSLAYDNFIKHPKVKTAFDNRRIDRGQIDPKDLPNGATYIGFLKDCQCDAYMYDEWYLNDSDVLTPLIVEKNLYMGSTRARTDKHYAAIQDLRASAAVPRFPKTWEVQDPSARFVMVQSAPLMALTQVDAFLSAQVY